LRLRDVRAALQDNLPQLRLPPRLLGSLTGGPLQSGRLQDDYWVITKVSRKPAVVARATGLPPSP